MRLGTGAGDAGIAILLARPASAISTTPAETMTSPPSRRISKPPAMVPARMARKVPASIKALPPINSPSSKWSGRMLYLTGPKKADCIPIRNNTVIRKVTLPNISPAAPNPMIATSAALMARISRDFSNLSAICPAVAENRKNGRMKRPAAAVTTTWPLIPAASAMR